MIHGSSGNMRDLILALEDTLAPHFRLIIFDRPGLGYSDRLSADGDKFIDQAMILRMRQNNWVQKNPSFWGIHWVGLFQWPGPHRHLMICPHWR